MSYSKVLFDNLPLYARLADDMGVLQIISHIGIQPLLDSTFLMLSQREALFDPYHPAIMGDLLWAGQFVGLGAIGNHYLGIGLNPKWSPQVQLDVIFRAPNYWKILGTDPGIIEAISMWLRFDGTIRIYQPMGHTPTASPPRWADYYTSYDDYALQNFEDCRILGGPDTPSYYKPSWHRYSNPYWEWDYQEYYNQVLEEVPAPRLLSSDPGMGSRHSWKFFELDKNTWGQIFPDIEILDIEALPALTKPTNVGWLSYQLGVDLSWDDPRLKPAQERIRRFDMDGFRYDDCLAPPSPQYTERIETKTVTEIVFDGNYLTCADYFDTLFGFPATKNSSSSVAIAEVIEGIYPGCGYDELFDATLPGVAIIQTTTHLAPGNWEDSLVGGYDELYFIAVEIAQEETVVDTHAPYVTGGLSSFYVPPIERLTTTKGIEAISYDVIAGGEFYYSAGEQEQVITITSQAEYWDCEPGIQGVLLTGYRDVIVPAQSQTTLPDWILRELSAQELLTETETEILAGFEGATYEDSFGAYALHAQVGVRVEETASELAETNQLLLLQERPRFTVSTTTELQPGYGNTDYEIPLVRDQVMEFWSEFDQEASGLDLEADLASLGEVKPPPLIEQLFSPVAGLPLEEENFFPASPVEVKITTVVEDKSASEIPNFLTDTAGQFLLSQSGEPLQPYVRASMSAYFEFETPVNVFTYETDYATEATYWIAPAPFLPPVVKKFPIYDNVILPGEPFYYGATKTIIETEVSRPLQLEVLRSPADYFSVYGESLPFEYSYTSPKPATIVQEPVWETINFCHTPAFWTTFAISGWFEEVIQLPLDRNLRLFHPLVDVINQQALWHLVLQTDTGTVISTPSAQYWENSRGERSLSFDRIGGFTNLYLEFVVLPDVDWLLTGFTLNLDSKAVKSDDFTRSLVLPKRCIMGFRFSIVGVFS